jgi:hypothetical protein
VDSVCSVANTFAGATIFRHAITFVSRMDIQPDLFIQHRHVFGSIFGDCSRFSPSPAALLFTG